MSICSYLHRVMHDDQQTEDSMGVRSCIAVRARCATLPLELHLQSLHRRTA
jgi:hypothetical protein